jgi:zinc/manganese transport system substrate-binding protein
MSAVRAITRLALPFVALALASCAGPDSTTPAPAEPSATAGQAAARPTIVVTYSVLGRLVEDLVDGAAEVVTIIPDGRDPHDYQPSARDMEAMTAADLLVVNGLGFEEYLDDAIDAAADAGTPIFAVSDHVTVRDAAGARDEGHDHDDDSGSAHGSGDPHLWLSPATMLEALPALTDAVSTAIGTGIDPSALTAQLLALDADLAAQFAALGRCELVTGHDELGYFADRYGCEVIGAVVPSMSTTADASANQLAALKEIIAAHGATTVFTSLGTPQAVAGQIARETGANVVELGTHVLGGSGSYAAFIRSIADDILGALR